MGIDVCKLVFMKRQMEENVIVIIAHDQAVFGNIR